MVSFSDIDQAYQRIQHLIVKTPLLTSDRLNDKLGFRLFIKAEPLQRTGAFKFRGACNAILSLEDADQPVIAFSSGNHAQAVAFVARLTGRKATIIMPQDAPEAKIAATRDYGADVVLYDRYTESREEIGKEIAEQQNGALIKPYDHEAVIAGQGTYWHRTHRPNQSARPLPSGGILLYWRRRPYLWPCDITASFTPRTGHLCGRTS